MWLIWVWVPNGKTQNTPRSQVEGLSFAKDFHLVKKSMKAQVSAVYSIALAQGIAPCTFFRSALPPGIWKPQPEDPNCQWQLVTYAATPTKNTIIC